jgi:hypothetical protein
MKLLQRRLKSLSKIHHSYEREAKLRKIRIVWSVEEIMKLEKELLKSIFFKWDSSLCCRWSGRDGMKTLFISMKLLSFRNKSAKFISTWWCAEEKKIKSSNRQERDCLSLKMKKICDGKNAGKFWEVFLQLVVQKSLR